MGVALFTPITTGVGERIDGVRVGGRKGVGGVYGEVRKNQPLQDVSRIDKNITIIRFISSPPFYCTPYASESKREVAYGVRAFSKSR
jgi:hypothetical protein